MTSKARCFADILERDIKWLWEPYVPSRMLSLLDGDPGCGKSHLTLAIAATLSRAEALPGSPATSRNPCRTLLCACEDPPEEVIKPRLRRLGADMQHVYVLGSSELECLDEAGRRVLREAVGDLRPRLFTVDTIVPYLPPGASTNTNTDVRPTLRFIADLCHEFTTAGLVLRHLRKSAAGGSAIAAGAGSMDFIGTCRSSMIVHQDPEDTSSYILAHAKSNLTRKAGSWKYGFAGTGAFEWRGRSDSSADELFEDKPPAWLERALELQAGGMAERGVASEIGIPRSTMKHALSKYARSAG
jgi:DNA repair protein RadA/Sms